MITVQLWVGVVFLVLVGLIALSNLRLFVRGRYFAEQHSEGVEKGLWGLIRWFWAIVWLVSAILSFFLAHWLVNYILAQ
ncbi:MAG: hypothetical protein JWN70_2890 [Planctomycetaceae bacterium]|nr:hypothetical protein [Planctomycetaceae bacterium]